MKKNEKNDLMGIVFKGYAIFVRERKKKKKKKDWNNSIFKRLQFALNLLCMMVIYIKHKNPGFLHLSVQKTRVFFKCGYLMGIHTILAIH